MSKKKARNIVFIIILLLGLSIIAIFYIWLEPAREIQQEEINQFLFASCDNNEGFQMSRIDPSGLWKYDVICKDGSLHHYLVQISRECVKVDMWGDCEDKENKLVFKELF